MYKKIVKFGEYSYCIKYTRSQLTQQSSVVVYIESKHHDFWKSCTVTTDDVDRTIEIINEYIEQCKEYSIKIQCPKDINDALLENEFTFYEG